MSTTAAVFLPKRPQHAKQCTLDEMLFPVENLKTEENITINGRKLTTLPSTSNVIIGVIDGVEKLLYNSSKRYELIPCGEIFPVIEQILKDNGIEYEVYYYMFEHSRFFAEYIIKSGAIQIGDNPEDVIFPTIIVEHSYNGRIKYKLAFGFFRQLCTNGLAMPISGKEKYNYVITGKHTKQIKASLEKLLDKFNRFIADSQTIAATFESLQTRVVTNWQARILAIIEHTNIAATDAAFAQITGTIVRETELLGTTTVNDWLIYNAFNQYLFNPNDAKGKKKDQKADFTATRKKDEIILDAVMNKPELTEPKDREKLFEKMAGKKGKKKNKPE